MANFRVELSELELIQIIGAHIQEKYNLDVREPVTVAWEGNPPSGAVVASKPLIPRKPVNMFED